MQIKFYKIKEDRIVAKKNLIDTGADKNLVKSVSATIKGECTVEKPTFELEFDSDLIGANYFYVAEFSRYYYITGRDLSTQRIIISGEVDVLYSFLSQIYDLDCVVARQADKTKSNWYLNDGIWKNLQMKNVIHLPFPNAFDSNGSYVLCVGGRS